MAKPIEFVYRHKLGIDEFSYFKLGKNVEITVEINEQGGVDIIGNSKGFLYLAKYFAELGLIKRSDNFHIHLSPEDGDVNKGSLELSLFNYDHFPEEKKRRRKSLKRKKKSI